MEWHVWQANLGLMWKHEKVFPEHRKDPIMAAFDKVHKPPYIKWTQDYFYDPEEAWMHGSICGFHEVPDKTTQSGYRSIPNRPPLYDYFCFTTPDDRYISPMFKRGSWWFPCGRPYENYPKTPESKRNFVPGIYPHLWLTLTFLLPIHLKTNNNFVQELIQLKNYDNIICSDMEMLEL